MEDPGQAAGCYRALEIALRCPVRGGEIKIRVRGRLLRLFRGEMQKKMMGSTAKLFYAVAFFDLSVRKTRSALVARARFGHIQIIIQIVQFLAQRGDLFTLLANRTRDGFLSGFNHKRLFDYRFCVSQ